MFRRELLIVCSLAAVVFLLVTGAASYVARAVQQNATSIAEDTLPRLVDAGAAISRLEENWLRIHQLNHGLSPEARATLIQQILAHSTQELWREYQDSILPTEDRTNYDRMIAERAEFLKRREKYLGIVQTDERAGASTYLESQLTPAFERYREASEKLFAYDSRVGRERAAAVVRYSRAAPVVLGAFTALVFALGVSLGLHGAFTGIDLASRTRISKILPGLAAGRNPDGPAALPRN